MQFLDDIPGSNLQSKLSYLSIGKQDGSKANFQESLLLSLIEKQQEASDWGEFMSHDKSNKQIIDEEIDEEIDLSEVYQRRLIENAIADKLEECADSTHMHFYDKADKMRHCRRGGFIGWNKTRQSKVIAWNEKCGDGRLCPDESRAEAKRLDEKYREPMQSWVATAPKRSLQYGVFTLHNFKPGDLARGKQYIFQRFKETILDAKYFDVFTGKMQPLFPEIKGALVVQEDPLSASREWNVHLNVIMCVEGYISWRLLRAIWGFNVHFDFIGQEEGKLSNAIRELVKYIAKHITPKKAPRHDEPADDNDTDDHSDENGQPDKDVVRGMLDWSPDEFREWVDAQKGFRRTRAYGCLYAIHRKVWDRFDDDDDKRWQNRIDIQNKALTYNANVDYDVVSRDWKTLSEDEKRPLRKAIDRGINTNGNITWLGTVQKNDSRACYEVDLIPADKSVRFLMPEKPSFKDSWSHAPPFQ